MDSSKQDNVKVKVLLVSAVPPPDHGGIANWTRIVCKQLADDPDCELILLGATGRRHPHVELTRFLRYFGGAGRALSDIWRFYWKIKCTKPDVVHLCTSGGPATIKDRVILAIPRRFRVPTVIHYHMGRLPSIMAKAGEDWNLTRSVIMLADATAILDNRSERLLRGALPDKRIVQLKNPVELDLLDEVRAQNTPLQPDEKGVKFVFVGHVTRKKGLTELITACSQVPHGELLLDVVGPVTPEYQQVLETIAAEAGGGEWLRFRGTVSHTEAVRYLASADVLVLPSHTEGAPNVILEALACGKPVIGTTVGAVPEMLDIGGPQQCGVCVPPQNIDILQAAIKDLLGNERQRQDWGERGRQRAESLYAAPCVCRELVTLWKSVHSGIVLSANASEASAEPLKVLLGAPLPPPYHGGIGNWTRIIIGEFMAWPGIRLTCVDTAARYRLVTNTSMAFRLVGGSMQALRDTYRLFRKMKTDRPDVLHLCTSGGPAMLKDWLILRIAKSLNVPTIIHYRMGRIPAKAASGGISWRMTRRTMSLASAVVVLDRNSEACVKAALPHSDVRKLPNMVEIDAVDEVRVKRVSQVQSSGPPRIVYVGQVLPTKGIHELVWACAQLPDRPKRLVIVGPVSPAFRCELQKIAVATGNGEWLEFVGSVDHDEAIVHIHKADIFVLPSYTEGMPNVVLEAMACGKAIISTTVGAVPEMLDIDGPRQCGLCVPPRDKDALAAAISQLLDHPEERESMGKIARQRAVEYYSVPVGCSRLMDLWQSAAQSRRSDAKEGRSV